MFLYCRVCHKNVKIYLTDLYISLFSGSMVFWLPPCLHGSCQRDCWWSAMPALGQPPAVHIQTSAPSAMGIRRWRHSRGWELLQEPGWWHLALVFYWRSGRVLWLLFHRRPRMSSGWEIVERSHHWRHREKHCFWLDPWKQHTQFHCRFFITSVDCPKPH